MVLDFVGAPGFGALKKAMDIIEEKGEFSRPWVFLNASPALREHLYLPALSAKFREKSALAQLIWIYAPEAAAPLLTQKLLESHLCEGVLLLGLEHFSRSQPAALWARRWQLAAERGSSSLFWVHEKKQTLMGVQFRAEWVAPGAFHVHKGRHIFEKEFSFVANKKSQRNSHHSAA